MAATTGRLIAFAVGILLATAACSNADDDIGAELDAAAEAAETSSTTTTTRPSTTTTSEPSSTTLSELEAAEAEIRQVVIEWYEFPLDYSLGEEGLGLEQTTGLLRQRIIESAAQLEAEGQILRSAAPARIEIVTVDIELEDGMAEVEACTAASAELLDADTLEVINATDPAPSTSSFQLQLVEEEWKISEWVASGVEGTPIECEIGA